LFTSLDTITFILREKEDALLNAKYLRDKGVFAESLPIVYLEYFDPTIEIIDFDYLVITSPKAVHTLNNLILSDAYSVSKKTNIFAIGLETNKKLKIEKYKNVFHANGNSKALFQLILNKTLQNDKGLWITAKDRSFDLQSMLKVNNRNLEIYESYKTLPINEIAKNNIDSLVNSINCNLLILSARNVLLTKNLLEQYNLFEKVNDKAILIVNSYNVSQKAKKLGWKNVKIIKKNFTKDILDYIVQTTK
jgi:uroporphyrinogen-III synthase